MKPLVLSLIFICFLSCKNNAILISELENIETSIKQIHAPDKRVELFDIQFKPSNNQIIATGETTSKIALSILKDSLLAKGISFENKIRLLPDAVVGTKIYAIANNSVINIRSAPKHSAELGTQALLGMTLKVLDQKGDFYRVQTPDNYISWVDKGGITRMNPDEFLNWKTSKKVLYLKNSGYVYSSMDKNTNIISDITLGGILIYLTENDSFYQVKYPDNRIGYIKKTDATIYKSWLNDLEASEEHIERVAKKFIGFPYLWGGTSSKGIDCSGFTKMVYLMNGFIISRDASQQINSGKIVDNNLDFSDLKKGDLLFFGKKATKENKQKVTHVGIWLGNGKSEFIHASGNVHLSSMDNKQPHYDDFNKNRYLGSRRYLNFEDKNIVSLKN